MSETQVSKSSSLLTFLGSLGAILIFALILFVAYLPNRPDPVNAQVNADRQAKADEARAAGMKKLNNYEVIDASAGTARIPIQEAMNLIAANYDKSDSMPEVVVEEVELVSDAPTQPAALVAEELAELVVEPAAKEAVHEQE